MNIFAVNAKGPALQRNFKSISKGSRTRLAGVMAKKRSLEFDDWEEFIMLLRNWKNPNQHTTLDGHYTSNLDALPVNFSSVRKLPIIVLHVQEKSDPPSASDSASETDPPVRPVPRALQGSTAAPVRKTPALETITRRRTGDSASETDPPVRPGNNDTFPRSEVNAAMRDLIEIIWKEGGYRFRHTATNSPGKPKYVKIKFIS
ncbi:hypothetical protein V8E54_000826 [Elaphomyces granulatus]